MYVVVFRVVSCGVSVVSSNTSESGDNMSISLPKMIRDIFTLEPDNHPIYFQIQTHYFIIVSLLAIHTEYIHNKKQNIQI